MIVNTVNHSAVPQTGDVATGKSQGPCTNVPLMGCEPKPHIVSPPVWIELLVASEIQANGVFGMETSPRDHF